MKTSYVAIAALLGSAQCFEVSGNIEAVEVVAPKLAKMMRRAVREPELLAKELREHPIAEIAPVVGESKPRPTTQDGALPIVVTHGMGDSCFNAGMKSITKAAGDHQGVYSVCVPGGKNDISDTLSGFLTTMDKNVDIFAAKVKADDNLSGGFDAFGLSQGNSVLRGYIQRYNDPPVRNYLGVHGTVMGVAGFPNCNPVGALPGFCDMLAEALGTVAYDKVTQGALFQANYFRDPTRINSTKYLENSQIAQWNNENTVNATLKENFGKVKSFNMVKALKDTMVYPNEGEWWGEFSPGQFKDVLSLKQTPLYTADLFGLKTADEANKFKFNTTAGEHLQFTVEELEGWIDQYFQ